MGADTCSGISIGPQNHHEELWLPTRTTLIVKPESHNCIDVLTRRQLCKLPPWPPLPGMTPQHVLAYKQNRTLHNAHFVMETLNPQLRHPHFAMPETCVESELDD